MPEEKAAEPIGIVVVDDHESVRTSISRIVSLQEDMTILGEAANGRLALEVVERTLPDLVLVDIRMPEMDGLELIRILRGNYPDLKIVALSAHEDELYVSEALKHGADTYVLKGVPLKELVGTIRRVMQGRADLPSEVTEPLIKRFRLADSVLGILDQAFTAFQRGGDALEFLASSAADLCGGDLYALAFRGAQGFHMEPGRFRREGGQTLYSGDGWCLSTRDLSELVAMAEARHPVVCNEHRLRDRAKGWKSPFINIILNPVFVEGRLDAVMMVAGAKPFHLSPPHIRYLNLLSDQAAAFLDILALRSERSKLEAANRRVRALLRYVVGEMIGGGSLQKMLEILVESLGLRSGAIFRRSEGGRWIAVIRHGLSEEEAGLLAVDIAAKAGDLGLPETVVVGKGHQSWTREDTRPNSSEVLVIPVAPSLCAETIGTEEGLLPLEDEGLEGAPPVPSHLLALVLPEGFDPVEEKDVLRSFAFCVADHLRRLSEMVW